ncbi:MAG: hypothetical protein II864_07540 [Prevotella sp.]|nr:hypothetical protein [Prevotella sp.]
MKKTNSIFALLVTVLTGLSLASCGEDDLDTNQYLGGVSLNAYGPNPVMRGGTLRFVGSNLDQIASIQIPCVNPITNYDIVKSGTPSEIRVTVPKDGPTVGIVTLTTKGDQTITTKSELTYTEPIVVEGFSPASAMPGDLVTIKGDYLNLIQSLAFADGVIVGETDFKSHDRYTLTVTVPEEAQTGKIDLYTADLTVASDEELDYQIITTDEAIEIGTPTISSVKGRNSAEALGAVTAKAGETITVTGTYFNMVKAIRVGTAQTDVFTVADEGRQLSFVLPVEAPSGDILLVCKSDVEVPVATLTTVKPSECTATPSPAKAGQALTVNGKDMDLVTAVLFSNVADAVTDLQVTADKVVVTIPETATEGLQLVMANGETVDVATTLIKPTVTGYDNATVSAGGTLTIKGTNLDLVKTVQFGDGSDVVKVENATAEAIILSVPMNALSGAPTLTLANGTTVADVPAINVQEAVFCYFTEMPAEDAELKAGDSFALPVANGDKLTGVEINGEACQYVLTSGNQLIIGIPGNAKKGAKVRLVSSNGEITYTIDFIPNTEVTTVLWTGQAVVDEWKDQPYVLSDAGQELKDAGVVAGDIISFHITPLSADWKIEFVEGHWGATYASVCSVGNDTEGGKFTEYDLDANKGYYSLVVTEDMLEAAFKQQWWGGVFVLNGDNVVVDRITTTHYESAEETVWTGEAVADDWGNQPYILSDGGTELLAAGMKVGSIIRIYLTATDAAWNCQIVDGHWNPASAFDGCDFNNGNWNLAEHNGALEITVTDYIYEHITTSGGWGGSFLLNGDNVVCTKVTIE